MNYNDFLELAKTFKRVPVFREVDGQTILPIAVFQRIKKYHAEAVLLESLDDNARHFSFIAFEPMAEFRSYGLSCSFSIGSEIYHQEAQPLSALRQRIKDMSCAPGPSGAFSGSIIGFLSYDAVRLFEHIPNPRPATALPDVAFDFFRNTLCYDHQNKTWIISHVVDVAENLEQQYLSAQNILADIELKVGCIIAENDASSAEPQSTSYRNLLSDVDDAAFQEMVLRAKQYIQAGDVFQVVLSRSFLEPCTADAFDVYKVLRQKSPTPYLFYLPIDGAVLVGASPEKLVSVQNNKVSVNPIAGSRQRMRKEYDEQIRQELLSDEKELAEHMMLVDLARNDVGHVAKPGTVEVNELLKVKHFSHVSHITSTVTGQLRESLDALDALQATFPAGTLSGAPKIRAMEIIDELELTGRGLYGGTICRMDYQGNLDSCIAFRMAVIQDGVATVRAGAGIVFDSSPQMEADETRHKALSMLSAIRAAQAGVK